MNDPLDQLPANIRDCIRGYVLRRRRLLLLGRVGIATAFLLAWALAWCLVDRWLQLPASVRFGVAAGGTIASAAMLLRPVVQLFRPIDWTAAAWQIESATQHFHQRLVTVVSQVMAPKAHRGSDELVRLLARRVSDEAGDLSLQSLLPRRLSARPWMAVMAVWALWLCVWAVPAVGLPQLAVRFALPLAEVPPVTTTHLRIRPGTAEVLQGQSLEVVADVEQLGDSAVTLHVSADGRHWSHLPMAASTADHYRLLLPRLQTDLWYRVTGGDAQSDTHRIRVLRQPVVTEHRVRYRGPSGDSPIDATFSERPSLVLPGEGEVGLSIRSSEPLRSAVLITTGQRQEMTAAGDGLTFHATLPVNRDTVWGYELVPWRGPSSIVSDAGRIAVAPSETGPAEEEPASRPAVDSALPRVEDVPARYRDAVGGYFRAIGVSR